MLPLCSCQTLPARHIDLLLAVPLYYSQRFCTARQTIVRDAASLAKVMTVDGAKHGVRDGKSLPATGLAMSPIPALVKRPRFKTTRAHVCDHAPENTQNRAARCCYATHSRLTSPCWGEHDQDGLRRPGQIFFYYFLFYFFCLVQIKKKSRVEMPTTRYDWQKSHF